MSHLLVHLFSDCWFFTFFNIWRERENKTAQFYSEISSGYYERDNTELSGSVFYLIPYGMSDILSKTFPTIITEKLFKSENGRKTSSPLCYIWDRETSATEGPERESGFYLYIQNKEEHGFSLYRDKILVLAASQHGLLCYGVPLGKVQSWEPQEPAWLSETGNGAQMETLSPWSPKWFLLQEK